MNIKNLFKKLTSTTFTLIMLCLPSNVFAALEQPLLEIQPSQAQRSNIAIGAHRQRTPKKKQDKKKVVKKRRPLPPIPTKKTEQSFLPTQPSQTQQSDITIGAHRQRTTKEKQHKKKVVKKRRPLPPIPTKKTDQSFLPAQPAQKKQSDITIGSQRKQTTKRKEPTKRVVKKRIQSKKTRRPLPPTTKSGLTPEDELAVKRLRQYLTPAPTDAPPALPATPERSQQPKNFESQTQPLIPTTTNKQSPDLQEQIRTGIELKPVGDRAVPSETNKSDKKSLQDILRARMAQQRGAVTGYDDEEEEW